MSQAEMSAEPKMERATIIYVHSENIRRYTELLQTDLTDQKRRIVRRLLAQEQAALLKFSNDENR